MGGFLQLTGSPLVVSPPFPLLANDDGPATIVIRVRAEGSGGQSLATYVDGHQQAAVKADKTIAIRFLDPRIGCNNLGENAFRGEIAEVLVYDRARGRGAPADRRVPRGEVGGPDQVRGAVRA